jgi:hypothetical protein
MVDPKVLFCSVGDPDPEEPGVFGAPGSGSVSKRVGYGPFSFLIKVLIGLKILDPKLLLWR